MRAGSFWPSCARWAQAADCCFAICCWRARSWPWPVSCWVCSLDHIITELLGIWLRDAQLLRLTGWTWLAAEFWLIALGIVVGLAAALLPAIGAYRTDIARTLARA